MLSNIPKLDLKNINKKYVFVKSISEPKYYDGGKLSSASASVYCLNNGKEQTLKIQNKMCVCV